MDDYRAARVGCLLLASAATAGATISMMTGCESAARPAPVAPNAVAISSANHVALLVRACGEISTSLELTDSQDTEFVISRDGSTTRNRSVKKEQRRTVALLGRDGATLDVMVRIDAVPALTQTGAPAASTARMCGILPAGKGFRLPETYLPDLDVWRVTVQVDRPAAASLSDAVAVASVVNSDERKADKSEVAVVLWTLQKNLQSELHFAVPSPQEQAFYQARAQDSAPSPAMIDAFNGAIKGLAKLTSDVNSSNDGIDAYGEALRRAKQDVPLAASALDEVEPALRTVQESADELSLATNRYTQASKSYDEAKQKSTKADVLQPLADKLAVARKDWYQKAKSLLDSVHLPKAPASSGAAPDDDCKAVWESKDDLHVLWKFGTFDFPSTDLDHTVEVRADRLFNKTVKLPVGDPIGVWATHGLAANEDFTVSITGQSSRRDPVQVLASFVTGVAAKLAPTAGKGGGSAHADRVAQIVGRLEQLASVCTERPANAADPETALAPFRSWARDVAGEEGYGLQRDWTYTLRSCFAKTCAANSNFGTVTARTPPGWGLTLLGALTYSWNTNASQYPTVFPQYQWRPTAPGANGEQTFSLDTIPQPGASIGGSLLLALLSAECSSGRWGVGVGPTIIDGTGSALQEWTADLIYRPPSWLSDNLYLVLGGGFRLVTVPLAYRAGQTVTLPFGTGNTPPAAPQLATRTDYAPTVTFGLGVDLTVLGSAANSIFGSNITISQPTPDTKSTTDGGAQ
jgi:hypothetical protein